MNNTTLNDKQYQFHPLELYKPDHNYAINEQALQESITTRDMILSHIRKPNQKNYKCHA